MNFSEPSFWFHLALVLGLVLSVRPFFRHTVGDDDVSMTRYDKTAILIVGLYLLGCVSFITLCIFLFVCVMTYAGLALFLSRPGAHRYIFLFVLVPLQLAPLVYYKYSHFIVNEILGQESLGLSDLIIPIGLSFYTFQVVGFVVDTVIYKHPLPRFLDFLNFAGFFPQIVAGPIERRENLLPQMETFRFRWEPRAVDEGAAWMVIGLFFKVCLADNLAVHFDPRSADNPFLIWLNNIIFGLRIYYDFAGYSFIALGVARCLGIRLTLNFTSPYIAGDAQEFWRRWHITLSTWFRDYVYLPLGGNRTKMWALGIFVVFVISGIWHGAGWNFILWGAIWAAMLLIFHAGKHLGIPRLIGWILTMLGAFFAWLFFYETRTPILLAKTITLLNPLGYTTVNLRAAIATIEPGNLFVLSVFLLLALATLALEWLSLHWTGEPYALFRKPAILGVLVVLTVLLAASEKNDFIYFAF
ncbi:MAG: MBOAT family protein [Chthoniobacterales bacterium]|nr:MBOAT family protein [Chthoniobacterales bacterium]